MWSFCTLFIQSWANPASVYLFKVNNGNIRKMCLQLTITTPERRQWSHSGAIVDFQHFSTSFWYFYCWLWKSKCWLGTRSFQNTWFLQCLMSLDVYLPAKNCNEHSLTMEMSLVNNFWSSIGYSSIIVKLDWQYKQRFKIVLMVPMSIINHKHLSINCLRYWAIYVL